MSDSRDALFSLTIAPGTAGSGEVKRGQRLRVTDLEGGQVGDLVALRLDDASECLDCAYTNWANIGWRWKQGATLFTNRMNRMWWLADDPTGIHFTGGGFCSNDARRLFIDPEDSTKGCRDCLQESLAARDIAPHYLQAVSCISLFMNVEYAPDGSWQSQPPVTQPGDYIEMRAEMDIFWALSVCVMPGVNRGDPTPLKVEIF